MFELLGDEDDKVIDLASYEDVPDVDDGFDEYPEDMADDGKPMRQRLHKPSKNHPFRQQTSVDFARMSAAKTATMMAGPIPDWFESEEQKRTMRKLTADLMDDYLNKGGTVKKYDPRGELK